MTYKTDLTQEEIKELLKLDEEAGRFYWLKTGSGRDASKPAGYKAADGYRSICIKGSHYKEHRLVWLYLTGNWPSDQIDHINGVKDDNRMSNLREATASTNQLYRKCKGVKFHQNRYQASLTVDGVTHYLGRYATEEEAKTAYEKAKAAQCDRSYEQTNLPVLLEI